MTRPLVLVALIASVSSCGLLGKRVSEDDCVKWDKHYREVLERGIKKRLGPCKDDNPAAKGYLKNLDETVATAADGMSQGCQAVKGIGSYTAEEEKCFMDASDPKDWSKCAPKPTSAVKMFITGGTATIKSADSFCKGAGDDEGDDSEKPKKKSKKKPKAEDDE